VLKWLNLSASGVVLPELEKWDGKSRKTEKDEVQGTTH
jgi:hypothetical protein